MSLLIPPWISEAIWEPICHQSPEQLIVTGAVRTSPVTVVRLTESHVELGRAGES